MPAKSMTSAPSRLTLIKTGLPDAQLLYDADAASCLQFAIADFVQDAKEATGKALIASKNRGGAIRVAIVVAVLDQSGLLSEIDPKDLGDLDALRGLSESFRIFPLNRPFPNVSEALMVVGSDPNGAMYGLYELSERIFDTDPMKFWTDFIPDQKTTIVWREGSVQVGPPTFRYRGIFINDEDSLIGWRTNPVDKLIDEDTYARIVETVCRLKGNLIAPAMFAQYITPATRKLVHDRGLSCTGSHVEILLSNPQNYWEDYSQKRWGKVFPYAYTMHPEKLREYWADAIARNRGHRNIWPVGLKGITDFAFWFSDPNAPASSEDRADVVNRALHDQLALLGSGEDVVAALTMREELLGLYNTGRIQLPSNVILVWDDDGQSARMRQLPDSATQERPGGNGVYYHLAYCDNPWLQWVPLEVIRDEFVKIVAAQSNRYALFNVGNIREIPLNIRAAMNLVWDAEPWISDSSFPSKFLRRWTAQHFGREVGGPAASLYSAYLKLEYVCRATSIVEGLISHTTAMELKLLAPAPYDLIWNPVSALDWVTKTGFPEMLRWYADTMRFGPFHARLGTHLSEKYLAEVLPQWESLYAYAIEVFAAVPSERRTFFQDNILLHILSSRAVNRWANASLQAFAACRADAYGMAAERFEEAGRAMDEIFIARERTCQGKWSNWYRGEYYNVWATCPWALKPDWHARDSRQLAHVARQLAEDNPAEVSTAVEGRPGSFTVGRISPVDVELILSAAMLNSGVPLGLYVQLHEVTDDATVQVDLNGNPLPVTRLHAKVFKEVIPANSTSGIADFEMKKEFLRDGANTLHFAVRADAAPSVRQYWVAGIICAAIPTPKLSETITAAPAITQRRP